MLPRLLMTSVLRAAHRSAQFRICAASAHAVAKGNLTLDNIDMPADYKDLPIPRIRSEYMKRKQEQMSHEIHLSERTKKVFFYLCVPAMIIWMYVAYKVEADHLSHPRPEFIPYEHLNIRTRPFPWGDGNHSLLFNKYYNTTPEGYEAPDPALAHGHHGEH